MLKKSSVSTETSFANLTFASLIALCVDCIAGNKDVTVSSDMGLAIFTRDYSYFYV